MKDMKVCADRQLPFPSTVAFLDELSSSIGDADEKVQEKSKKEYGCGFCNIIGELIYAMVTCRPDTSFATVKCAQSSAAPAPVHYRAAKHIMRYLYATRDDGIYFWRTIPRLNLPNLPLPLFQAIPLTY